MDNHVYKEYTIELYEKMINIGNVIRPNQSIILVFRQKK